MVNKNFRPSRSLLAFAFLLSFFFCFSPLRAQEFFCSVSVQAPQLQSDRQVYTDMQKSISEYMNFRQWSNHKFEPHERIKVTIQIIINDRPAIDYFKGSIQIRVVRPVFNSTYETVLFDIRDQQFSVKYVPFQTLEYSENSYIDNLTSILNFYAYMILAWDYDSFQENGGRDWFSKAQNTVNLAQGSQESGWRSFDASKSKYWLSENMVNSSYKKIHNILYMYHRQGLDLMEKDLQKARSNILTALKELQKLNVQNPGLYIVRVFMESKRGEIPLIFSKAMPHEQQQILTIVENLDPSELNNYKTILEGKE